MLTELDCENLLRDQRELLARTAAILAAVGSHGKMLGEILGQLGHVQEQIAHVEHRLDDHELRLRELERGRP